NPPWDNSAMDGYAVRREDAPGASKDSPARLKVIYDLPAGSTPGGPVGAGEAVRIMTGAPVPEGADAVVMVERTEKAGGDGVLLFEEPGPWQNIRRAGEDFAAGAVVIRPGAVVRPAEIAMLATTGVASLSVYKRPKVAIISTGDELVDIDEAPGPGKIPDSNGYTLSALVAEAGAEAARLGIARDDRASLTEKLTAARSADIILSSGGVSVGDYDFVKDVLEEMGSTMRFWKVAMKPGKPLAFGVIGGKPAFGLPGNPVSSMVAFEQFVRPVILKLSGRTDIFRAVLRATLTGDLKTKPGRMNFVRAEMSFTDEGFTATPLTGQGSGVISTMVKANCYVIVPADCKGFRAGETVRVQPFDSSVFLTGRPGY
ncbi:MAG: gephyrin-like molybdotransferase Glp, partial [Thermodesulfobacteriota bacterium]